MFSNAKVGERVWCFMCGWGTIKEFNSNNDYPIDIEFIDGLLDSFTVKGFRHKDDLFPSLFWDEVKFNIPNKPITKMSIKQPNEDSATKEFRRFKENLNYWISRKVDLEKVSESLRTLKGRPKIMCDGHIFTFNNTPLDFREEVKRHLDDHITHINEIVQKHKDREHNALSILKGK